MKKEMISVVIVDDHAIIRESWKIFLDREPGMQLLASCSNGPEALELLQTITPHIMLVDVQMKPMDGLNLTKTIKQKWPHIRIIGTSLNNHPNYATKMMEAGAHGFVTKDSPLPEIAIAIHEVYNDRTYICEEVRKRME